LSSEQDGETQHPSPDILPNRLLSALLLRSLPNKTVGVLCEMSNDVTPEIQSAELSLDGSDNGVSVHDKNLALKKELWERGISVVEIGATHIGECDYLVVTCAPPKDTFPIDRIAN